MGEATSEQCDHILEEEGNLRISIALLHQDNEHMKNEISKIFILIKEISEKMETKYVTKEEFMPIKSIVYGMVGLICISVFSSVIYLVLNK